MRRQLVFCVESGSNDDSDWIYISEILRRFYNRDDVKIKLSPIYLNGKGNYRTKNTQNKINKLIKMFSATSSNSCTEIIYVIDTDNYDSDAKDKRFLDDVLSYCHDNNYKLIWFCKDIECVLLGKKISNSIKTSEAIKFKKNEKVFAINERILKAENIRNNASNILVVLDEFLVRKK